MLPATRLHLYGKTEAKAGRKMSHLTLLADSPPQGVEQALAARGSLAGLSRPRDRDTFGVVV